MNSEYNNEITSMISLEAEIDALYEIIKKIFDEKQIRTRRVKYKLDKYIKSKNCYERLFALNKIVTDGKGIDSVPNMKNVYDALESTNKYISELLAKRYVQNNIEKKVESNLIEKQDKYMDEIRLGIIKKQKGPENSKTLDKYERLKSLDSKKLTKNIQQILRPSSFDEIVGQETAIESLLSKLASPYPQHIMLFGPPGVGKTTAARLALEEAKKIKNTPFEEDSKFIEVDGTTMRWDPREIVNPLLGSVHDPIYQGSKRDLSESGIPEPKPGLVTDAHGGVLFIDEIGELDSILQNKLLKVLEDKRVEFSSSYYDPDDDGTPKYVKYLFDKGAPADFILIGATTREPGEINSALRSRCAAVYFQPLTPKDIQSIVKNAAAKINVELEEQVPEIISRYTIEGRKAVSILSDAYGYALYSKKLDAKNDIVKITEEDLKHVISVNRLVPYEDGIGDSKYEVGHVYGLGVSGYLGSTIEIEAVAFKAKQKGKGHVRFNDTAGSMAKDSVFNAASVIRKIADKDINDYDIHVNVIGGGKIDGPSAGTAITTCILSAILDKPIRQDVAITGEISLKGKVKPVGGVPEKIYGAKRKGINMVIIPKDNEKEVSDKAKDILVKPVEDIEEVINIMFK